MQRWRSIDTAVAVFGATGHTGQFVVDELRRRGRNVIACGRDANKLRALEARHPQTQTRCVDADDPGSIDRALCDARLVVNCAGPFLDTAQIVIDAAIRGHIHYLDVTAEQPAAATAFERFDDAARAGITVVPAMAFYGGLADLLATASMKEWPSADSIEIAVALDSWHPTQGTRITGKRNTARRVVQANGRLQFIADPLPTQRCAFAPPFGEQEAVGLPFSEIITIARHLRAHDICSFINLAPLTDIRNPDTPAPQPADNSGRSSQAFAMSVTLRRAEQCRRAVARGRDIYAATAPLVVEAAERILDGRCERRGVLAAGEAFDAADFLRALDPSPLAVEYATS